MSQKNRNEKYLSNCQVAAEINSAECPVITTGISSTPQPSQKRKEEAKEIIYLKRV
jgi:hypothetical protein